MCSILELVRTHFAVAGDEQVPRKNSERWGSRTTDNFKFPFDAIQFRILTNFSLGHKLLFYESSL